MDHFNCKQEPAILRIEKKLDKIDEKLDRYHEKTVTNEEQIGFIRSGFIVFLAPLLISLVTYAIVNFKR